MIFLLYGENEFAKRQKLAELVGVEAERYDGEELDAATLRDILQGQTLFVTERTVVISNLSDNSELWANFPELAAQTDTTIILLETKPDKRTKTYKWLTKQAEVQECVPFGERDGAKVSAWLVQRAKQAHKVTLTNDQAQLIVERLGHDQLRLDKFLEQLALADTIDEDLIRALLPMAKSESAFELFEAVLDGDKKAVKNIIHYLETTGGDDAAYQTLGLVTSQLTTLAGLVLGGSQTEVASDLGAHPFVVRKLANRASQIDRQKLRKMIVALAYADQQMKATSVSPWLLLEAALIEMTI